MDTMDNTYQQPPPPNSGYVIYQPQPAPKRTGWKIFFGIVLCLSIMANLVLFIALIAAGSAMFAGTGSGDYYIEKVIEQGSGSDKIAVIKIEGIIDNELARQIDKQIKQVKKDKTVKAVIFKTTTPGGGISASDRIYDLICRFRADTGKPTVAFMDTIAASGGFYTSAACDKIIAEPTAITGSIGVIMGHFVLQDLLELKLGIKPVIVKSSPRKDWPTSFEPVTEEQLAYLNDKLIMPAYERFVNIVAKSRKNELTAEQVRALADGSIYNAQEALEKKLIDEVGYMSEAIKAAETMANISDAKVVEYEKPFSFENILGAQTLLRLNRNTLYEFTTPQLMYLWDAGFLH